MSLNIGIPLNDEHRGAGIFVIYLGLYEGRNKKAATRRVTAMLLSSNL